MIFQGQVTSSNMEAKLNAWEVALYEFATQTYVDQPIKMLVRLDCYVNFHFIMRQLNDLI